MRILTSVCLAWCLCVLAMSARAQGDHLLVAFEQAGIARQHVSVVVQAVQPEAQPLWAFNANNNMPMASTAKLFTSVAALDLLGAKFAWQTRAYATGPVQDGVLNGDLWILGGGDARLTRKELLAWFKKLQAKVHTVQGSLVIDQSLLQTRAEDHEGTPEPSADNPRHAWPQAFVLNSGIIQLQSPGQSWSYSPPMDGVVLDTQLLRQVSRCGAVKQALEVLLDENRPLPVMQLRGQWAPGCLSSRDLKWVSPPGSRFSALAAAAAWRDAGGRLMGQAVQVSGQGGQLLKPHGSQLLGSLSSPRLARLIHDMNKVSDNPMARHLMLSWSKGFPSHPATLKDARKRFAQWRRTQGWTSEDVSLDNGSGLSRGERARAAVLADLLRRTWRGRWGRTLYESLPIAGHDGTLATRMTNSVAQGRAFLKTGTLTGVRALAGYVHADSGRLYAVVVLVNDPQSDKALPAMHGVIEWVITAG